MSGRPRPRAGGSERAGRGWMPAPWSRTTMVRPVSSASISTSRMPESSSYACTTTLVQASVTAIFMSARTEASKSSASAIPASAWRTTPTPSGLAGIVSWTSGAGAVGFTSLAVAVGGPGGRYRLVAAPEDREDGDEAGDVQDPLHAGLDAVPDADDVALAGFYRPAARVQQRAQHGRVHERGAGEVDDDAAAAAERLLEPLAQRRRGVDVVLALHDDDHDVVGGLVEHDGVCVHTAVHDTHLGRLLTQATG